MSLLPSGVFRGRTVAITGATGFLGARLVERLVLNEGAQIRAMVRRYSSAARLARFDVKLVLGSLEDETAICELIEGAEFVFNLAYVMDSSIESNLPAIGRVIDACLANNVERLVHTSSFMVYEPSFGGKLTDDTPIVPSEHPYAAQKFAVENAINAAVRKRGLRAAIIRPSIVYGPFGGFWTDEPARDLMGGRVVIPEDRGAVCNLVYIDDVVDALLLTAARPEAIGETYNITGPDTVAWFDFYEGLRTGLPGPVPEIKIISAAHQTLSRADVARAATTRRVRQVASFARSVARPIVRRARKLLPESIRRLLRPKWRGLRSMAAPPPPEPFPSFDLIMSPTCEFTKATKELGYEPAIDCAAGLAITQAYLRWAYQPVTVDLATF